MELEFEAGYEQFDMNISETLLDLHNAYPGILTCWDLASNQNEGLDLSSLATELNEAHHKETAVSQFQVDVVQQFQDSNCNSSTTNLSSDGKLRDDVKKISESSYSNRGQRQSKQKLRWTPELHGLFVEAVEKLGVDNAVPTKILDLMGVPSLTRYHIASHLQKYRATVKGLHGKEAGSTRKLRRQQLMCLNTNRSHDLQRSQPADAVFNTQCNYPAGDQSQSQPSNCMPILPATIAPATAVYEHSLARYLHGAAEDKEPVCSLDFQAHINSIATFEPWKDAVEQAIREDAVEQAIREALNDPCSHLPIGLIPPSPDSLTDVKSNGVDTRF